jgi:hypothetical protein
MKILDLIKTAGRVCSSSIPDALMIGGVGSICYGAALVYYPAGYIVGGILAGAVGYFVARGPK